MTIPQATLCGWMARAAGLLTRLYDLMAARVRSSKEIHTDDTTMPVWDPTLPQTRTGRFWVYVGDDQNPFCVYDFTARRTRDGPETFLRKFSGSLQADAFPGYNGICFGPDVRCVACWAHARRMFFDARTSDPRLAHEALARIRQLYEVESTCRELTSEERHRVRQRHSVPLLHQFVEWLEEQARWALHKSPIDQAIVYARNQWPDLQTSVCDGDLSIDNNLAERTLRAQAIGRKNYLFVGSDRGGRTAAILYSVVGSCKRLDGDPFAYLKDVLERLPTHSAERLGALLPDAWYAVHPNSRRKVAS